MRLRGGERVMEGMIPSEAELRSIKEAMRIMRQRLALIADAQHMEIRGIDGLDCEFTQWETDTEMIERLKATAQDGLDAAEVVLRE